MDQIVALPARTLTVTMVCAGNRRKEQNMHKKSQGFNWGAAAVSTAMWTGVLLRDLLLLAGLDENDPLNATRHVRFCGPAGELPKGSDGRYGSSITLPYALNQANDVLLAYKQNGRWLAPDHGFPIRLILPGHIGGRTVKWLERIEISDSESDNWYHYHDNRVLPPHVRTPKDAEAGGYWRNPDYVINHLNINSAISSPSHDAVVPLRLGGRAKIPFRGYAYSGGGRKITRVELSLDGGKSWPFPAVIHRGEPPTRHGMHWAWVHWSIDIALGDLLAAKVVAGGKDGNGVVFEEGEIRTREIALRAADSSMNYQPGNLTWSLLGMMGNQHYRLKMHVFEDPEKDGELGIRFQHPAPIEVGPLGNVGWREEAQARASSLMTTTADGGPNTPPASESGAAAAAAFKPSSGLRKVTQRELARHASEESAWFSYRGRVFDGTRFLEAHPGGAESILISAGMDATEDFDAIHSAKAKSMLEDYLVGELVEGDDDTEEEEEEKEEEKKTKTKKVDENSNSTSTSTTLVALDPRAKRAFPLVLKERLSENTRLFRFALPTPAHVLGLPVGKHVFLYGAAQQHGGNEIMRAYTPISSDADAGKFELVVKVYDDKLGGGMMSRWLDSLAVGDTVNVKGPVGHFVYEGNGVCSVHRKRVVARAMTFIAAGTGITPCYAVLRAAIDGVPGDDSKGSNDATRLRLIYANRHEEDVLLKSDLDALAARSGGRLEIVYTISRPNRREEAGATWSFRVGRIDEAMLKECAIAPSEEKEGKEGEGEQEVGECLALMCGPHALLEDVCSPALERIGFPKANVITF
jgi:nitrate reductase (NAD(P)H)